MTKPDLVQTNVPDGGWGWVVVAGVALTNMFCQSILSLFGLLFGEYLQTLNQETTGAALITNLNSLAVNFSGLFIAPAIKTFAPRKVAFVGSLLTSTGLMLCAASTQLWHIIIGYSLFVGIGLGLIAPSTFMVINSYFTTKRGRAVGISLAGTGVGQMILPHIVRILLDNYGFRVTIFTMGALSLHGLLGALLFRPVSQQIEKGQNIKDIKLLLETKEDCEKNYIDYGIKEHEIPIEIVENKSKLTLLCEKLFGRVVKALDLELLKDPIFLSITIGLGLVYTSTINFSMLFPYFLQNSIGLSRKDTALCMSSLAGADIISRLLLPIITDKLKIPYRIAFMLGAIGLLIARTLLAETVDFYSLLAISAICGCVKSATVINSNLTISNYCKPEKLAGGLGLNMISKGLLVISLGQLLGWIRDYSGSYSICLHAQNSLLIIVIIMWIPEIIYKYLKYERVTKVVDSITV